MLKLTKDFEIGKDAPVKLYGSWFSSDKKLKAKTDYRKFQFRYSHLLEHKSHEEFEEG